MGKNVRKVFALLLAGAFLLSSAAPVQAEKKQVDLGGTYHAALGVSTATQKWINRNAYYDKSANTSYGTENFDKLISGDSGTGQTNVHEGTFTDTEIKGNGTYTVKLEDADFEGETTICMLHVATDIPVNSTIQFTDVSAKINGRTVLEFDQAFMEDEEPYLGGGMDIILLNHWREALVNQLNEKGFSETTGNGYDYLLGTGNETIEVTFTVSGFNYDKEAEETPAATQETAGGTAQTNGSITVLAAAVVVAAVLLLVGVVVVLRKRKK